MWYIGGPLIIVGATALQCLNLKIGFIVGDRTEETGFNFGFYFITVVGLMAAEISLGIYLGNQFL